MLTVSDVLAIDELRLAPVAGLAGAAHPVRFAHSSELEDPTPWLRGGEILLTLGGAFGSDPGALVERLAEAGLAALGLGRGFRYERAPAEAVRAADRLGFPLFEIPYEIPFIAIAEAVAARLAGERLDAMEALTTLVLRDMGLEALLSELGGTAGWALRLDDAGGDVLARTADFSSGAPGTTVLPVMTGASGGALLLAHPGAAAGDRPPDHQLLRHVQALLGCELLKRRAVREAERRLAGELVDAVLDGEMSARELARKARAFGLGGGRPLTFVVLQARASAVPELLRIQERARDTGPATIRDGAVCVLVEACGDEEAEQQAARLLERTAAAGAGVGRVRQNAVELPAAYEEALYASELRLGEEPAVATFRDLGTLRLLLAVGDERGIALYCESLIGPLLEHDREQGSALVESLEAYLEANGRWAEAAAALGVHRHTLRYRLRKVAELTRRDLADSRDRLELALALRARRLRESRGDALEAVGR